MIISNIEGQAFASFTLAYIIKAFKLPAPQTMMTYGWVNSLILDFFECAKWMMVAGKQLQQKSSVEYETASLHTPYRIITPMQNKIFGQGMGNSTR